MKIYVKGKRLEVFVIDTANIHKSLNYSVVAHNIENNFQMRTYVFNEDGGINCSILSRIFWWMT